MTVTINQMEQTPGGSTKELRSEKYNFKQGAAGESAPVREKRLDVKRGARRRCLDKFDDIKKQQQLAQRRAARQGKAAAKAADTAACARVHANALLPAPLAVQPPDPLPEPDDLPQRRDWALLRAWKVLPSPDAVLESLRASGLDDEEDPWTVSRVTERHAFLCRSVRLVTRLLGEEGRTRAVRTLAYLCE
uniref:Uncharacterized protein n=1 Tax=Prymnesium polylepis TaxID=72548 RepID=A0A7S4M8R1_9EUKA